MELGKKFLDHAINANKEKKSKESIVDCRHKTSLLLKSNQPS